MAHIQIRDVGDGTVSLTINGIEFAFETFVAPAPELVESGDGADEFSVVCLRLAIGVSRLDLNDKQNVQVTDRMEAVNEEIRKLFAHAQQIQDGQVEPDPEAIPLVPPNPYIDPALAHGKGRS